MGGGTRGEGGSDEGDRWGGEGAIFCMCMCVGGRGGVSVYVCMLECLRACVRMCMHVYVRAYVRACVCVCALCTFFPISYITERFSMRSRRR